MYSYKQEQYQNRDKVKEVHTAGSHSNTWDNDLKQLGTDFDFMFPGSSGKRENMYFHTVFPQYMYTNLWCKYYLFFFHYQQTSNLPLKVFFWPKKPFRSLADVFPWYQAPADISGRAALSFSLRKVRPAGVSVPLHWNKMCLHFDFLFAGSHFSREYQTNVIPREWDSFALV